MKRLLLVTICLALLASGCIEREDASGSTKTNTGVENTEKLIVTIASPSAGEILHGNKDVTFDGTAKGGKEPYSYSWSSNIDGALSMKSSFRQNPSKLSKGHHNIILTAIDSNGNSGQGSVLIEVM